jgi:hypothetical protein|tara:strand:+ start:1175 stop:2614 length:1440 start_codon:yes stop_codon:yes gene_type:complete
MATSYWTNLLKKANRIAHDRTGFEQIYYHKCEINRAWTEAAIAKGFTDAGFGVPGKTHMKAFVDAFHNYISKKTQKARTVGTLFKKGRPEMAPVGRKSATQGKVVFATNRYFITSTGTYLNTILGNARNEIRKEVKKRFPQLTRKQQNETTNPLQFAHGEGTDDVITTLGALSQGEKVLNEANSQEGIQKLLNVLDENFANVASAGLIQSVSVASLRDYMKTQLKIDIDINEKSIGDKVTFKDEFLISGAAKIQTTGYMFDKPSADPIISGINKRYLEAVQKALRQNNLLGNKEYSSSPRLKERAKSATIKQVRLGFKELQLNPNFQVIAKGKHENFKKKTSKTITDTGNKRTRTRTFRKAMVNQVGGQDRKTTTSPISLMALINAKLPDVMIDKMKEPRLQERTGRFRGSARVQRITTGARGGSMTIDYTYLKYPYQTFEPGFAQGSIKRDPRSLIGSSIREIATGIVGKRFMTIRRT